MSVNDIMKYVSQTPGNTNPSVIKSMVEREIGNSSKDLPIANTANIGQTIVVKTVNENGKPLEWEAKDYQPRTHWAEENVELLSETTIAPNNGYSRIEGINRPVFDGEEYIIVWNEIKYLTVCIKNKEAGYFTFENIDGLRVYPGGNWYIKTPNDIEEVKISIYGNIYKKIPEKYLPELIVSGSSQGSIRTKGAADEFKNYTMGDFSFAEGGNTQASGYSSHAEGVNTIASGKSSHAEGSYTEATAIYSHAEGYYTKVSGMSSHAEGNYTRASNTYCHVEGNQTTALGEYSHAEGGSAFQAPITIYQSSTNEDVLSAWQNKKFLLAKGNGSHAEGWNTLALDYYSHAEGNSTISSGASSHAEGSHTEATASYSHAEGSNTTASGIASHAEGDYTKALGESSHAEGANIKASGDCSHAEGWGTEASGKSQHVQGEFNIVEEVTNPGERGKYAHIVGNGTKGNRSNAHTLDWEGNAWFAGGIELTSPNGTRYRFTVTDDGTLNATAVPIE